MAGGLSVVIPALNEETWVAGAIDSAFAAGAAEVLVSDGGSSDATVAVARAQGAVVIEGARMRARQSNRAAAAASGEFLLFLHADTRLPPGASAAVARALDTGALFGGFRIAFAEPSPRLRFAAGAINLRTRITRCPWGDQAQFIHRAAFQAIGGFREIPLMEDYDLARRMKRAGRTVILPQSVITSGRRFLRRGLIRTAALNWRIVLAFRLGADPEALARKYRAQPSTKQR